MRRWSHFGDLGKEHLLVNSRCKGPGARGGSVCFTSRRWVCRTIVNTGQPGGRWWARSQKPGQGGSNEQVRKWAFIRWRGQRGRGSARGMSPREDFGCCEWSGYRMPGTVAGRPFGDYCPFPAGAGGPRSLTQTTRVAPGDPHTPTEPTNLFPLSVTHRISPWRAYWVQMMQTARDNKHPGSVDLGQKGCQEAEALFKV